VTDLAELAYHAYGDTTDHKNFLGDPMPEWVDLPEKIKDAWFSAAIAVRASVRAELEARDETE